MAFTLGILTMLTRTVTFMTPFGNVIGNVYIPSEGAAVEEDQGHGDDE
jgi:hypothetical protein